MPNLIFKLYYSPFMTISLNTLQFYCYHGLYEEETKVGGTYFVDADIEIKTPATVIQSIDETVNYAEVYAMIRRRMMQPTPLLETIAMELANEIVGFSDIIKNVSITIKKTALPIEGFQGNTSVRFFKENK